MGLWRGGRGVYGIPMCGRRKPDQYRKSCRPLQPAAHANCEIANGLRGERGNSEEGLPSTFASMHVTELWHREAYILKVLLHMFEFPGSRDITDEGLHTDVWRRSHAFNTT